MDELNSPEKPGRGSPELARAPAPRSGAVSLLILALLIAFTAYRQAPPDAAGVDAPAASYSSGRAMKHLAVISRTPHAIGSSEHAAVRSYLLSTLSALGLQPEVQDTTVLNAIRGSTWRAATVRNVLVRLEGTRGGGKALLLAAHYDTVPNSPGASDDGASVVTLLETVRALKAGAPLLNDVIFLFTDAEEIGLLGAKAFADEHPWAKDVGLVLNFEARGAGGPTLMFETSDENGSLISELAKAAPRPVANSLSYEIYKRLPNDTDLTVFKNAGLPGMNFAYIDGVSRYHTQADSIENIDERSLQHQGEYALSLARHLGNSDLERPKEPNAVYFDVLGAILVHYPGRLIIPLAALTLGLFVAVVALGLRRRRLTLKGVAAGFSVFVLTLAVASAAVGLTWWLISSVQVWTGRSLQDDHYRGKIYLAGFALLAVALTAILFNVFRQRVGADSLTVGALLCWLLLLILTCLYLPGASYLTTWPLMIGLFGLALTFLTRSEGSAAPAVQTAALALCAAPAVVLLIPTIYNVFVAMGLGLVWAVAVLIVLACGLLTPYFGLASAWGKWLPRGAVVVAALLLALAAFNPGFDASRRKTDHLFYVLNADTGLATWASSDRAADEWTAQFFPANAGRAPLTEFLPLSEGTYLRGPAPAAPLRGGSIEVTGDSTQGEVRTLSLRVTSPNAGVNIGVPADARIDVLAATVNGKRAEFVQPLPSERGPAAWAMQFWSPAEQGFNLTLELKGARPVPLKVIEQSYGLPPAAGTSYRPRPDHLMPSTARNSELSLISKSYAF